MKKKNKKEKEEKKKGKGMNVCMDIFVFLGFFLRFWKMRF